MEKREEILENALELFCGRGYDAVGVQEIAERAGVTKPTLYYYFKSKYGLLRELLERGCAPFLERLEKATAYDGDLMGTLCACARAFVDFAKGSPRFYDLLFSLFHFPKESEPFRCARPYVLRQQELIRNIFEAAAGQLGNMHGRQKQFCLGFSGLIHYFIEMKFEENTDGCICVSDEEIYSLVHQFMHGIYS
ncbi:MAG: TetR/AcrR family transcriptional regulator [Lachnospiraceae bacterium]|nr:TetR/AcrR family transcriptional regulator [Lachnospiraceae bacterium]